VRRFIYLLNWKLQIKDNPGFTKGNEYFVQFNGFDESSYYKGIASGQMIRGGSIITLGMQGIKQSNLNI
jgi:hypothetical protein